MTMQTIQVQFTGADAPAVMTIAQAAQNARLYRISAKALRKSGHVDGAKRMERNARAAERAIVKAADALIAHEYSLTDGPQRDAVCAASPYAWKRG
jgi:hypothetical protein